MFFIQPTDHPMIALKMIVGAVMPSLIFDASELQSRISIGETFIRLIRESGYMHLQATKPDTVGM
jgi:juvenile hormone epoxide hydrolase